MAHHTDLLNTRYNEVLYEGRAHTATHPDRLATIAILSGMSPAPLQECRILEIGCSDGINLMSMAHSLPESVCVGVDFSERAIAIGREMATEAGVNNVSLLAMDIMDITPEFGTFDYIIAHGIYSWVPAGVREKLLTLCKENLSPQGVAYISYNTYPGWYMNKMAREMLLFQNIDSLPPEEQMNRARATLRFLAEASSGSEAYRSVLEDGVEQVTSKHDYSLFHDELATINDPCYFHEFARCLASRGLQYLGDAEFSELHPDQDLSDDALRRLDELDGDRIAREQFLDFLKGRRFRRTLLCHDHVQLTPQPDPDRMSSLFVESPARPIDGDVAQSSGAAREFKTLWGTTFETDTSLTTALFHYLGAAWPRWTSSDELLHELPRLLQPDDDEVAPTIDRTELAETLISACSMGLARLHAMGSPFTTTVSAFPTASLLARTQARHGTLVTSLSHESLDLGDSLGRELLLLLDGTRDCKALAQELMRRIDEGTISAEVVIQSCGDLESARENIDGFIERTLKTIADHMLLIPDASVDG